MKKLYLGEIDVNKYNNLSKIVKQYYSNYFRLPVKLYTAGLFVGFAFAIITARSTNVESNGVLPLFESERFIEIATTNCLLILSIYIASIITKWYGYFIFISNGFTLGYYLSWIINSNLSLIWLILPHGVFEIPIVLLTGFIVTAGDRFIHKNIKTYLMLLGFHLMATLLCAAVESYITPLFQTFISVP